LRFGKGGARNTALGLMPFLEKRAKLGSHAIVQNHQRSHQICSEIGASGESSVAVHAFGGVQVAAPVGRGGIHFLLVARTGSEADDPASRIYRALTGRPSARPSSASTAASSGSRLLRRNDTRASQNQSQDKRFRHTNSLKA